MQSITPRIKVGVLMGGISLEREVSLSSGRTICDHLDTQLYEIIPLFQTHYGDIYLLAWHFLHRGKTTDFIDRLENESQSISWEWIKSSIDIMYLAVHGRTAEDGTLQGMLELMNIPYVGSKIFASALRANKHIQKSFLNAASITTPQGCVLSHTSINDCLYVEQQLTKHALSYPLVVKPLHEGSSLGVSIVLSSHHLADALRAAAYVDERSAQDVLIEQKIEGTEFSCTVLGDDEVYALEPTEIIPDNGACIFDYHQKYMPGLATKITPARFGVSIIQAIKSCAIKSFKALSMSTIGRIDGFVTLDQQVVIIDVNALSGTDPSSFVFNQAAHHGMNHAQLINHIIKTELRTYGIHKEEYRVSALSKQQKIRVGVIMGGTNNEKETSLNSGRNVVYKLSEQKYEAIALFLHTDGLYKINHVQLVCHSTASIAALLDESQRITWSDLPSLIDFAFIALHGGIGENGTLQGALETLGIAYNGSGVLTSALCMNKAKTNLYLQQQGFEVPCHILIKSKDWLTHQESLLDQLPEGPWVIKPHDDGCSVLVYKATTLAQVQQSIQRVFDAGKEYVMIEQFIQGMELTVGILGNDQIQVLPPTHSVSTQDILSIEEKFLPGQGQNITPAPLGNEDILFVQATIKRVYQSIGCKGYARIDCFFQPQRLIILEINTLPALTPATCLFHQAAEHNIKPMELIDTIIQLGLENHAHGLIRVAKSSAKILINK